MPIVARWLSTGPLGSTTSTSPAALPQDFKEGSASNPATMRPLKYTHSSTARLVVQFITIRRWKWRHCAVHGNLLRDLPEWLEDFTDNLVGEGVSASRDTPASTSRQSVSKLPRTVVSGKHSIFTHLPKNPNCEIWKRTRITSAFCKNCNGESVLLAENFGDLITADHKVLSEGCESRNNHRYAVVVQDLATQWIQSYPCKTKTSQETQRSLQKFLEPIRKPIVIYTDNFLEFANLVKIFPGIIVRRHHTDRKQIGLLEEQHAEWKKVHLQYCCNQVWKKNGGQIPWNALLICETFKISCLMGRLHTNGGSANHSKDQ